MIALPEMLERVKSPELSDRPSQIAGAIDDDLHALYAAVRPSVALVYRSGGNGAGIVWREDGLIVTNGHVVNPDGKAQVVLSDGRTYVGIVAARHPTRDLALVKIAADDLISATIGDSTDLQVGQIVAALGHPLGFRDSLTAGIIVSVSNDVQSGTSDHDDLIRTDARFARGNSGGPLVNAAGEVVGICTRVAGRLGMAVPSNAVADIVN